MKKNGGFTLIEVAFVLIIGGMIIATSSTLLLNYMRQVEFNTTQERLDAIEEATELFLSLNGRYPCPARLDTAMDTAAFGVEAPAGGAAACTGQGVLAGRDGRPVAYGGVPVRTLNLPDTFAADSWGGRFTYAVTSALARTGTYTLDGGGIFVVDNATPANNVALPAGTAHYAVVSHGKNNSGAFSLNGQIIQNCNAATLEGENCNFATGDAIFRSSIVRSDVNNANLYDDFVRFRALTPIGIGIPSGAVIAFNATTCPNGWVGFASAQGRFIAGFDPGNTTQFGMNVGSAAGITHSLRPEEMGYEPSSLTAPVRSLATTAIRNDAAGVIFVRPRATTAQGHNNLPPYVSLLYCQKS